MTSFDGHRRSFLARLIPTLGSLALVPMLGTRLFAGHKRRRYYRRVRRYDRRVRRHYYRSLSSHSYPSFSDYRGPRVYAPYYGAYYRRPYPAYPYVQIHVGGYGYRGYRPVYGPSPLDLLEY